MRILKENSFSESKTESSNELDPAQTSGSSPPPSGARTTYRLDEQSRCVLPLLPENWLRRHEEDRQKMARYIARCIPDEGMRVVVLDGNSDYPPSIADLTPLRCEGEVEVLIDTNDPEVVDLEAVYDHFRWLDMTSTERWRHFTYVPRSKQDVRPETPAPAVPHWDAALRTLFVGDQVAKRFKQPAPNQIPILQAFEEEQWSSRIDDPLPGAQRERLNDTISELNKNHETPSLIRFHGDGTGEGIIWKTFRPSDPSAGT